MTLPSLYKQTKTGAIQMYDVRTEGGNCIVSQGQVGGLKQEYVTECKPKNVGRANVTTVGEQAILEAKSKYAKKVKAGYTTDPSGEVHVKLPMKVQTYSKHMKKVIFPCFESPKLNGVNATYKWEDDQLVLKSRGGENYPLIDQHLEDIQAIMEQLEVNEINGEIYIHGEALQDITSAVKKYNDLTSKLEFHIFDIPSWKSVYEVRVEGMREITDTEFVKVVPVYLANSHKGLDDTHDTYVDAGYEGLMVRNAKGLYVHNTRSNDVFKLKKALDAEFEVVGHQLDKHGHAVFTCKTGGTVIPTTEESPDFAEHRTFKVKLKGTAAERLEMAEVATSYYGEWLKIEYEMLSNDLIPLKPVGIMFRKVDENGEALE